MSDVIDNLYAILTEIYSRPDPFERYTADILWKDEHISKKMLEFHLDPDTVLASRKHGDIDAAVDWITRRFGVGEGTAVADFGCGPGLYASRLARKGASVTGIDFSQRSIEYARGYAIDNRLEVEYIEEDYLSFDTDRRFDLVMMIYYDFCALSPEKRKSLLGKYYGMLKDGGALLMDVLTLAAFAGRSEASVFERNLMGGFWSPEDYFGFMNTFVYGEDKLTLDRYTIAGESGVREVYNWLQYFGKDSLSEELKASGFAVEDLYSDMAGAPYSEDSTEMAVVARRP